MNKDTKITDIILNNQVIPLKKINIKKRHKIIYIILTIVISIQILFVDIKDQRNTLFEIAKIKLQNVNYKLTKNNFDKRSNNLWINLLYYKQYTENINRYFKGNSTQIPIPKYPLISFIMKPFYKYHIFAPVNLVEIASFLRQNLGSGITIRNENKLIGTKIISNTSKNEIFQIIKLYKTFIHQKFKITVQAKKAGKKIEKTYPVSYGNIPNFYQDIRKLFATKASLRKISIYNNKESLAFFNSPKEQILASSKAIYSENIYKRKEKEIINILRNIENKLARIYTLKFQGENNNTKYTKDIIIRFDKFPNIKNIISDIFQKNNNTKINKITLYESKVLKHRANSRKLMDFREIPPYIRKAFILIEDDNFYIQAGGIDPIGLAKATFNYFFEKTKKGNASIIEQIYEMYLGKQKKTPTDKAIQVFGAIYLNYYAKNRDPFINLYIQSIPGSFFRDHNYGIKGIIKNYLSKNLISELNIKEIAWLTRIALLPNTFGQDYIRFHLLQQELSKYNVNILNDNHIKQFLANTKPKQYKQKNKKKNTNIENTLYIINRLRKAYTLTNSRINKALFEFQKGNEFVSPLITKTEYKEVKNDKIRFLPSGIINEYQSYTDQTLKEINKYIGKWAINSNLDIEVSFYEKEQKILEKELAHSTQTAYNYRYDQEAEHKTYGGASVLIKTHNIKTGKIKNKIIAIASKHTNPTVYFNWAVDGHRHFGSIFKWIVLMLYLDKHGTLLDTFYDIPRSFEYPIEQKYGKNIKGIYRPDNWRIDREYNYGHFTYKQHHNIYNFLQSKNNTFVKLADIVGLEKISKFLNKIAELHDNSNENLKFKAIYPIVLGSQDINSIRFAQINTVIVNKGILQPISTINKIIQNDTSNLTINLEKEKKQVVSREAAEGSLFCGYLNTYFGTARTFIKGGAGKTGSSDTDVSFIAATIRTEKEYSENNDNPLLNYNLLYLVNIGVNEGKVDDGLFGGNVAALNSKEVFSQILGRYYTGNETKLKYNIAGNFTDYFSKELYYKTIPGYTKINNKPIKAPLLIGKTIKKERKISNTDLALIQQEYESHKDIELEEQTAIDFAETDGKNFNKLSEEKQQEYRTLAAIEVEKQRFEYQFRQYEKQLSQVYKKELEIKDNFPNQQMENSKKDQTDDKNKKIIKKKETSKETSIEEILESLEPQKNTSESEEDFLKTLIDETLEDKKTKNKKKTEKLKTNKTKKQNIQN